MGIVFTHSNYFLIYYKRQTVCRTLIHCCTSGHRFYDYTNIFETTITLAYENEQKYVKSKHHKGILHLVKIYKLWFPRKKLFIVCILNVSVPFNIDLI